MYYKGSTVVLYWMKLSQMVVWVLRKIYRYIILNVNYHEWLYEYYEGSTVVFLLNVIVTNGCMSITKDLPFYINECNLANVLWRIYRCIILNETVTNGCMSDTTKKLMSSPKCRSVEVINNLARPGSNHKEVNCIKYKQQ
jgi:hypothetical protein